MRLGQAAREFLPDALGHQRSLALHPTLGHGTGIAADALLAEVRKGGTDSQLLAWVRANCKRLPAEIHAWSAWLEQNGPGGAPGHEWIASTLKNAGSGRDDIRSFADMLDLDDYLSYGGKA